MKHISKFTFSIALLLVSMLSQAQVATENKDSIVPKTERYGLRVGVDLYKLTRTFYEDKYRGVELFGDYRLTRKHYLAAEIGNEDKTVDEEQLNFNTKGSYIRVGFDYNTFQNWLDMENQIYVGLRYGFSTFNHKLNSYSIYDTNHYFGNSPLIEPGQKFDGLTAQWLEVVAGIKAEVFDNIFVGFSFRLNRLITQKQPNNFENLYIPGFNKTYAGEFGIGFNYSVSYFIPLYKAKVKTNKEENKNSK